MFFIHYDPTKHVQNVVNNWGTKFSRGLCWGQGLNFVLAGTGAFKHIYKFSQSKESKSNAYCTHIGIVDMILKGWSYNFLQCKTKSFFQKYEVETLVKYIFQTAICQPNVQVKRTTHQLIYTDLLVLLAIFQMHKSTSLDKHAARKSLHSFT